MAEPLSPADRSSLTAERGPINMAVGGVMVFERGVTYEAVLARLKERIHLIPRYRQRLAQPAMGLANPVWADDEAFDPEWHVRRHGLPSPGGDAELAGFVGREFSERLDRQRPLWELHLVEGLQGGRTALIPKMHHALVDGIAAVGVGMILLDPTRDPTPIEAPAAPWQPEPYALSRHLRRLATAPIGAGRKMFFDATLRALDTSPRRAAGDLLRASELVAELARTRPQAPMTVLNEELSASRSFALARAPLAALKQAGKGAGGTVNDAILAVVAGMLRRYFEEAGGIPPGAEPVALVPVSVRREGDEDLGNRISTVFVDLPVSEPDPLLRVERVNEAMGRIKGSAKVRAGAMIVGATGLAPPAMSSMLVRAVGNIRAFNLVVSNVPGPQQPFYLDGARLLEVFPVVPPNPANQRLTVGIISYDGTVCFGLLADRRLEPGVDRAALALEASLGELLAAARV